MKWYEFGDLFPAQSDKKIVVFGAGHYGQRLIYRLIKENIHNVIVYDNDERKCGLEVLGVKISAFQKKSIPSGDALYLVAGNENLSNSNAIKIYDFLKGYVEEDKIFLIKEESLAVLPKQELIYNSEKYVDEIIDKKKSSMQERINAVRSITYRTINVSRLGTTGGAGKILYTQELLLGRNYDGVNLLYSYKTNENRISIGLEYACANILGAVEFSRQISDGEDGVAYIAHDIFSGAGLAANGKKYILIYHSQGEMVYECEHFGKKFDVKEKELIRRLEIFSLKNAFRVIFPSKGAEYFLKKTWGSNLEYIGEDPAYNTLLYDNMVNSVKVEGIYEDDSYITFFSIGQMTESKGIDRIPDFLVGLSKMISKKIRWIVVADGVLKKAINKRMDNICYDNDNITYIQFDYMLHEQINYLFSISDVYLMLHRVSIFDLATLEAMYYNLKIILSDIPGNREYNINNNILLIDSKPDFEKVAELLLDTDRRNRKIFDEFFSNEAFVRRYKKLLDELVTDEVRM